MLQRVEPTMPAIPADIDTALAQPGWRSDVRWPVSLEETNAICVQQVGDALAFARAQDDALIRDAVMLALPVVLAYGRAIVLTALAVGRAERDGTAIAGAAAAIRDPAGERR